MINKCNWRREGKGKGKGRRAKQLSKWTGEKE